MQPRKVSLRPVIAATAVGVMFVMSGNATAATITFDDLVSGSTSAALDGDGDGINDVIFTTADPLGFDTVGPNLNQAYIHEPGLEGTSELAPDLRVDFNKGPTGHLSYGFALNSFTADNNFYSNFKVYDAFGTLLGEKTVVGAFVATPTGTSDFPEGFLDINFSGTASYATFDFTSEFGRYIIDDFSGNFGSAPVPEPTTGGLLLVGVGMLWLLLAKKSGRPTWLVSPISRLR